MDGVKDGPVQVGEGNSHVPRVQSEHACRPLVQLGVVCEWVLKRKDDSMLHRGP